MVWRIPISYQSFPKKIYLTNRLNPLCQSGYESNGNKEVLHTPQQFKTEASPLDAN